jgi:hypothetical protein
VLSVSNIGVQPKLNSTFKGSYKKTDKGNDYYHTNSAIKIGGVFAGVSGLLTGVMYLYQSMASNLVESFRDSAISEASKKIAKQYKNFTLISGLLAVAGHIGASVYVDKKRNEKAKEIADIVNDANSEGNVSSADDMMLSNRGNIVLDSKVGEKLGGWLGAGIGVVTNLVSFVRDSKVQKLNSASDALVEGMVAAGKVTRILGAVMSIGLSALGGFLLGRWSDNNANNETARKA